VGHGEEMRNAYNILFRKPRGRDYLGDLVIDWRMILKWFLVKHVLECKQDST